MNIDPILLVDVAETLARAEGRLAVDQMRPSGDEWQPVNRAHWDAIRRLPVELDRQIVVIEALTPSDLFELGLQPLGAWLHRYGFKTLGEMQAALS